MWECVGRASGVPVEAYRCVNHITLHCNIFGPFVCMDNVSQKVGYVFNLTFQSRDLHSDYPLGYPPNQHLSIIEISVLHGLIL